jgi:hypothetical protein
VQFLAKFGNPEWDVGASSAQEDPARIHYREWARLPYVTDKSFESALVHVLEKYKISSVYAPHGRVWQSIKEILIRRSLDVELIHPNPVIAEQRAYRIVLEHANALQQKNFRGERTPHSLSTTELAALLRQTWSIDGEMEDEKLLAFAAIATDLPDGDILEIGSLYGKSAYVLCWLAARYSAGAILCIDPWRDYRGDQVETADLNRDIAAFRNFELIYQGFLINLMALLPRRFNFLRAASHDARRRYGADFTVRSEFFGNTTYCGRVSLLHIDGNHDYSFVSTDVKDWVDVIAPGGWIVIDDYEWSFADGPRRAANEFVSTHKDRVVERFTAGGAIFLKLA